MLATAALTAALCGVPAAAQTTYNVTSVAELQAAVASVNNGDGDDTIVIAPGLYPLAAPLVIRIDTTIVGDAAAATVLDGGDTSALIVVDAGSLVIRNLTLQHATTALSYAADGVLTATGLTITGSTTGFTPGDAGGTAYFTNSTVAGNSGDGLSTACSSLHLRNVTVSGNARGIEYDFPCGETMEITNSIIAGNGHDCAGGGYFVPLGDASLDSDGTCVALGFGPGLTTASLVAIGLGPLAANGGPSPTEAIPPTSAAANAGDNATCPTTDERDYLRNDGACDVGAYEAGGAVSGGNTPAGMSVGTSPAPGVTLTFANVTAQGQTVATTIAGPPPPAGFEVDGVVYDITTTAQYVGTITVCLPYDPVTDPTPVLAHYETVPDPGWVDRTSSVDAATHTVCGVVSSLSPFAAMRALAAAAGDVGNTLAITKAAAGDLALSWSASCAVTDDDYGVYEGSLGIWYSHASRLCTTGGATNATLTPQAASAYYLVVPRNDTFEGSYGENSLGGPIPQGAGACEEQFVTGACP
jgi:hypothetical protein